MPQRNPIPSRVRGWILVAAIVVAGETPVTIAVLQWLEAAPLLITAASAQLAAVGIVAAALSRANLTLDDSDGGES